MEPDRLQVATKTTQAGDIDPKTNVRLALTPLWARQDKP
jgi:hypothetical protein